MAKKKDVNDKKDEKIVHLPTPETNLEDEFHRESTINYDPDLGFADLYAEIYKPEDYIADKAIQQAITKGFDNFLNKYSDEYGFLRSIDVDRCIEGDCLVYVESSKHVKVLEIDEDTDEFLIEIAKDKQIKVHKTLLKPIDEFINKLKQEQICLIYKHIKARTQSIYFDEMTYFCRFIDYFKITPTLLYESIPITSRQELMRIIGDKHPKYRPKTTQLKF